jgi:phage-related tail fiber protein
VSLPQQIKTARLTNSTLGSSIDDEIGNLEDALADIFGIPMDTNISAALLEVVTGGLKSIILQDATADPGAAGVIRRNAKKLLFHTGERAVDLTPTGVILAFGGSSAPAGYLLCDGAAVSRATYAALFAVIGTGYGVGDGATTFNLPSLKGRVPITAMLR